MTTVTDQTRTGSGPIAVPPPDFVQEDELAQLAERLGRLYFEALADLDEDKRPSLGAYLSTYDATSIAGGPSGTVVVISTLLSRLSQEEARSLAVEIADVLGRYA